MLALSKYYLYFFLLCLIYTMIIGVVAALIPNQLAAALTALPYLGAMISVLFIFLKQQRRAPTLQEKRYFAVGYLLIFWIFNAIGIVGSVALFAQDDPQIWTDMLTYLQNSQFLILILVMALLIAIPLLLITYWFYGKQAQRMAQKMFGHI